MKKLISLLLCAVFVLSASVVKAAEKPVASALSYILYCPQNGAVLLSRNKDKRMKPASTTKVMTTLLTLEAAQKKNKAVTFTRAMTAEGSSMYLKYGEQVRLTDLAAGMMMCSGNDAANAAAIGIAGSTEGFANLMNKRAQQLDMSRTHFVTPNGLDDEQHYTTAFDMALLMAAALKNPAFAKLTAQKSSTVEFLKPKGKSVTYPNHNKLLKLYGDCIGGKTGYTMAAGRCLVTAAKRQGLTLICVTFNDRSDWDDHMRLYDYGFNTLAAYTADKTEFKFPCVGGRNDTVRAECSASVIVVTPRQKRRIRQTVYGEAFVYAPVRKRQRVGRVEYTCGGKLLKSVDLYACTDNPLQTDDRGLLQKIKDILHYG